MEIKKRKIVDQALKKKKEKIKEKEIVRTQSDEERTVYEVERVKIPVMPKLQKETLVPRDISSQCLKVKESEKEEKIKPVKVPLIKLPTKKLEVEQLNTAPNTEVKKVERTSIPPTKLRIKKFDVAYNNKHTVTGITAKTLHVHTKNLQLKPIVQDEKRKAIKVEVDIQARQARELKPKQLDVKIVEVEQVEESVKEEAVEAEEKEEFEDFDFIESVLGKGARKIFSGEPLCIMVERHPEGYEYLVATICREVYREKRGGKPEPIFRDTIDEMREEFEPRVSQQIVVVRNAKYSDRLRDVLSEFFSRDLGFLILVSDNPEQLEEKIRKSIPSAEDYLVKIEPFRLSRDARDRIPELISGRGLFKQVSFGEDFMKAVKQFNDSLRRYLDFNKAPKELKLRWHKLRAKSPETSEEASDEHSAMKAFVWIYTWKKYKTIPELEDVKGVDVVINGENYEIETFYGCGDPVAKLTGKMEKFSPGEKVFFVLRNVSMLIHLGELRNFRRTWRRMGYDVELFGIDFEGGRLIPIEEFAKEVSKRM